MTPLPSTEHPKGKNNSHNAVNQELPVFASYSKGPQLLPREVQYTIDFMTSYPCGGQLKRTLRSLDFPSGSAAFLLWDSNRALISSPVMGCSRWGDLKIRANQGGLVQPLPQILSSSAKGWTWMVMVRISEYLHLNCRLACWIISQRQDISPPKLDARP